MALYLIGDLILNKIPDELLPAEEAFETGIVSIGYLVCHMGMLAQGVEFDNRHEL